jgi:hypothetical protein
MDIAKRTVALPAELIIRYLNPASIGSHLSFLKATSTYEVIHIISQNRKNVKKSPAKATPIIPATIKSNNV